MNNQKAIPLELIRGDTTTLQVTVLDAEGNPWRLHDGDKLIFGMKKEISSGDYLIKKYVDTGASPYSITLEATDTCNLPMGCYLYDIGLQTGAQYFHVVPISALNLRSTVTEWGC